MAFFVAGCSGVGRAAQEEAEAPADQPNIIFVLADDLDYASAQQMPEIDSLLRAGGASFLNASVSYPICCPSRATMLTGFYAHNHNVKGNKRPVGGFEKFRGEGNEETSIAARLQENGYRTALIGKYLNQLWSARRNLRPAGLGRVVRQAGPLRVLRLRPERERGGRLLRERDRRLPYRCPLRKGDGFRPASSG
jgi:hypothetical protein